MDRRTRATDDYPGPGLVSRALATPLTRDAQLSRAGPNGRLPCGRRLRCSQNRRFCGLRHTTQVLGDYVAIPNRRVTQLVADGARPGRRVQWLGRACATIRWPNTCARWHWAVLAQHRVGPTSWPVALPRARCLLRRHLGRRWAATGPQSSSVYFVLTTQVNGKPAFRHQLVPGTQLRFDGEWKVRAHTHRHTALSATSCPRPSLSSPARLRRCGGPPRMC